jgi:hypothetical protein
VAGKAQAEIKAKAILDHYKSVFEKSDIICNTYKTRKSKTLDLAKAKDENRVKGKCFLS